VAETAVEQL